MTSPSPPHSANPVPRLRRPSRPSFSSRVSFAVSNAEQGRQSDNGAVAGIVEEIDEIKRYETGFKMPPEKSSGEKLGAGRMPVSFDEEAALDGDERCNLVIPMILGLALIRIYNVGAAIGLNAAFLNIVTEWLSDIKLGYCSTAFYLNENFCCWKEENGEAMLELFMANKLSFVHSILGAHPSSSLYAASLTHVQLVFALSSASLVKSFAPYAAGSGISEIKCIIAGFVMKGFLGFWTLLIKSICLPLAIASGLSVGKEGPSVHYAVCTGNVISRFFEKYKRNAAKTREILSACAAAGVAVAFGSPIGGVLFSLEEMSSYFPLKTMWRSYFCALVATAVLAAMNPFRTGQLVMFQVRYDRSWHFFEIIFYIVLGIFGGLYGAFVMKWNLRAQAFRKKYLTKYAILEATLLAGGTAIVCYPNMFLRIDMTESMEILFLECEGARDYNGLCESNKRWRMVLSLAIATILRIFLVIISYGCKVPAGIFVPSMAIGASFGRMVGILVQALHESFPNSSFFASCQPDVPCITPGTYAFLGAGAALSGIMHITVSVVVIMFELTGALTYILPTMIVVGVTKAVGERFGKSGIADRMIWFNGFPFLDSKEEHTFGVPVSKVMTGEMTTLPASGLDLRTVENLLAENKYQGFPIVEDLSQKVLVGYIGRTELRYAIDRARREQAVSPNARCFFTAPFSSASTITPNPGPAATTTPAGNTPSSSSSTAPPPTSFDTLGPTSGQMSIDCSRYIDPTPLSVHPGLPLETVMELFKKMGPRVILIEYRGHVKGLVTVKDVLKYQFKVEALEHSGGHGTASRDDSSLSFENDAQEKLWAFLQLVGAWVADHTSRLSGGRITLGDGTGDGAQRLRLGSVLSASASVSSPLSQSRRRSGSSSPSTARSSHMLDGTENDDWGVELTDR
ncbi:MAG: hypothetical protein M1825_002471 [Sarcosagium campestre]|nr:MAG: hypothetical protein M1825_002471 [Sarcosagium campestre]